MDPRRHRRAHLRDRDERQVTAAQRRPGRRPAPARLPGTQQQHELVGDRLHHHHRSLRCCRAPRRAAVQVGDGREPAAITVTNASGTNGWSCSMTALRGGVGSGSPLDVPIASQNGNYATMTSPSVTTATNGALVTRWYASRTTTPTVQPDPRRTLAFGGTAYHTVTGVDHASSMAYLIDPTAGPTGTATMLQTINAADRFIGFTVVLEAGRRRAPGTGSGDRCHQPGWRHRSDHLRRWPVPDRQHRRIGDHPGGHRPVQVVPPRCPLRSGGYRRRRQRDVPDAGRVE